MKHQNYDFAQLEPFIETNRSLEKTGHSYSKVRQLVTTGSLVKLRKGVYIGGELWQTLRAHEQYKAHILALNTMHPGVIFSHDTAAVIHGLSVARIPRVLHIYTNGKWNGPVQMVKKHEQLTTKTELAHHQFSLVSTGLKTTLIDCAKTMYFKESVVLADSLMYRAQVPIAQVQNALRGAKGRGCRNARWVAECISSYSESPGESYVRLLLDEMGLRYREQVQISAGGRIYRMDFALENYPVAVEFDGMVKLTDYGPADSVIINERAREKDIQNAGWIVFRTNWNDAVNYPQNFKSKLWALLKNTEPLLRVRDTHRQ